MRELIGQNTAALSDSLTLFFLDLIGVLCGISWEASAALGSLEDRLRKRSDISDRSVRTTTNLDPRRPLVAAARFEARLWSTTVVLLSVSRPPILGRRQYHSHGGSASVLRHNDSYSRLPRRITRKLTNPSAKR